MDFTTANSYYLQSVFTNSKLLDNAISMLSSYLLSINSPEASLIGECDAIWFGCPKQAKSSRIESCKEQYQPMPSLTPTAQPETKKGTVLTFYALPGVVILDVVISSDLTLTRQDLFLLLSNSATTVALGSLSSWVQQLLLLKLRYGYQGLDHDFVYGYCLVQAL